MQQVWYETFFRDLFVEFWKEIIPHSLTVAEVEFLERSLNLQPGSKVLDVPCGNGRHSIELARRGYRVTAVDLSDEFLDVVKRDAEAAEVAVDARHGDMRTLDLDVGQLDAAFCFCNSFGYLDAAQGVSFLKSLARGLKSSGRIAIDIGTAAESILPALKPQRWHRAGDMLMLSECRYVAEASRLDIDYTIVRGAAIETRPSTSFVFTAAQLRQMFVDAGFDVAAMNGGIAGEPFQLGSPRLVVLAARR